MICPWEPSLHGGCICIIEAFPIIASQMGKNIFQTCRCSGCGLFCTCNTPVKVLKKVLDKACGQLRKQKNPEFQKHVNLF